MIRSLLTAWIFFSLVAPGSGMTPAEAGASPLWWTLTDELSPTELRALHENVELHRERYAEASDAGYRHILGEPSSVVQVKFFYDGSLHPELVPMWMAFNAFSYRFHEEGRPNYHEEAPAALADYGIEGEAQEKVLAVALRFLDESQELVSQLRGEQLAFGEILREAQERLDRDVYREAVASRDASLLARVTARDPARVERLMRVWERNPITERAVVSLRMLKAELEPADWARLRRFLLLEIAPVISVLDFDDEDQDKEMDKKKGTAAQ